MQEYGLAGGTVFDAKGCIRCAGTGYQGRVGIYEVMEVTEELRTLVLEHAGVDQFAAAAVRGGMRSMRHDGIEKVRQGLTTLAEVGRVASGA